MEIIRIVQDSELGVKRTLEELGISRSTFYDWYKRYLEEGYEGLKPRESKRVIVTSSVSIFPSTFL